MSTVAVIDYGMGNLHSIAKALQHADPATQIVVSADPQVILAADRVVFPGVGAMRDCMAALKARDLVPVIKTAAASRPLLGICLGMQALLEHSEENEGTACLGLIPGKVVRFDQNIKDSNGIPLKIPHMGWNRVTPTGSHPLFEGLEGSPWFYFVHSYYVEPLNAVDMAATTDYPVPFAAALAKGYLVAVQFHPEKSQAAGLRLLANFLHWTP